MSTLISESYSSAIFQVEREVTSLSKARKRCSSVFVTWMVGMTSRRSARVSALLSEGYDPGTRCLGSDWVTTRVLTLEGPMWATVEVVGARSAATEAI